MSARPLVLVVDDCSDTRALYAELLAPRFTVIEAASGREAVQMASDLQPRAIVIDLALPDMRGEEAISRLRREPRTRQARVLVVSGFAEPTTSARTWDAYFTKPCDPHALSACIGRLLSGA